MRITKEDLEVLLPVWIRETRHKLLLERAKLSKKIGGSKNYLKQVDRIKKLERKLFNQISYRLNYLMKRVGEKVFQFIYSFYQGYINDVMKSVSIVQHRKGGCLER